MALVGATHVRELVAEEMKTLEEEQRKPLENLKRFHVHLTRHTFASERRDAGGSLAGLKAVLGEQYGHMPTTLVVREARRLEELRRAAAGT